MSKHSDEVTREVESPDGRVIQENTVRISYIAIPYQPATGPTYDCGGQPAEGGYCEFDGAEILGNQGGWIELRPGDPLYHWAYDYFHDNEFGFATAAAERALERVSEEADYRYDQWRDDQMREAWK